MSFDFFTLHYLAGGGLGIKTGHTDKDASDHFNTIKLKIGERIELWRGEDDQLLSTRSYKAGKRVTGFGDYGTGELASFRKFIESIAALHYDGEFFDGAEPGERVAFVSEPDDAITTLDQLINEARELTGKETKS